MANTNWLIGIDKDSSVPGGIQVALPNHIFVDGSFVGASDGSPDAPYKTLQSAVSAAGSNKIYVIASGRYENETTITNYSNITIKANSKGVEFINTNKTTSTLMFGNGSTNIKIEGCYLEDMDTAFIRKIMIDCVIDNSQNTGPFPFVQFISQLGSSRFENCKFLNGTGIRVQGFGSFVNNDVCHLIQNTFIGSGSVFENPSLSGSNVYSYDIQNCDFSDVGFTIILTDKCDTGASNFNNCNFRGTQTNSETPSNLITETDTIDEDPLYAGNPDLNEYLIAGNSPLVGAGENNTTIGAFTLGQNIDFTGSTDNNVNSSFELIDENFEGSRTPNFTILPQSYRSPRVLANGILEETNIPALIQDNPITPNKLILSITFRETIGGVNQTGLFIYGLPMFQDNSGQTTGEKDFNAYDISSNGDILNNPDNLTSINLIDVAEIQPVINIVNRFDFVNGVFGDGVNDYIDSALINKSLDSNWTLVCWFRIGPNLPANNDAVYTTNPSGDATTRLILTERAGPTQISFRIIDDLNTTLFEVSNSIAFRPFAVNDYMMVAVSCEQISSGVYNFRGIIRNITQYNYDADAQDDLESLNVNLGTLGNLKYHGFLGQPTGTGSTFAEFTVGEFRFYDDFMSMDELKREFNLGIATQVRTDKSLSNWYKMDSETGSLISDEQGSDDLTMNNFANPANNFVTFDPQ